MKKLALAVCLWMPLPVAAQEPGITITDQDGVPQIDIDQTQTSCPSDGLNGQTRQKIVDAAAAEWSLFRFPRFALTTVKNYDVIPPGISPDKKRTRADATFLPRVVPVGHMEDDKEVRKRIGDYWASVRFRDVFVIQNQIWRYTDGRAGWGVYWSGAFVSFVMCKAGLVNSEFVRSGTHVAYIRPAVAQRDGTRSGYAYTAYDLAEAVPTPETCSAPHARTKTWSSITWKPSATTGMPATIAISWSGSTSRMRRKPASSMPSAAMSSMPCR